jgi:hypothetical protein
LKKQNICIKKLLSINIRKRPKKSQFKLLVFNVLVKLIIIEEKPMAMKKAFRTSIASGDGGQNWPKAYVRCSRVLVSGVE